MEDTIMTNPHVRDALAAKDTIAKEAKIAQTTEKAQ